MNFVEWLNRPIFIRGIPPWERGSPIRLPYDQFSVSLHTKGLKPLRPYGYILRIDPGAIVAAFDRDVCSDKDGNKKVFSPATSNKKYRNYSPDELGELLANTRPGYHNEIWIDPDKCDIIGAYVTEPSPGWRQFQLDMKAAQLPIERI